MRWVSVAWWLVQVALTVYLVWIILRFRRLLAAQKAHREDLESRMLSLEVACGWEFPIVCDIAGWLRGRGAQSRAVDLRAYLASKYPLWRKRRITVASGGRR